MTRTLRLNLADIVEPERFTALQELVWHLAAGFLFDTSGNVNHKHREAILEGCKLLRLGQKRPRDFYKSLSGVWGYWCCRFVRNAFQITHILKSHPTSFRAHPALHVFQVGGGPAEDLIGLRESFDDGSVPAIRYTSIDDGQWRDHLRYLQDEMLPKLYKQQLPSIEPCIQRPVEDVTSGELMSRLAPDEDVLLLVANAVVDQVPPASIARLFSNIRQACVGRHLTLALIEPASEYLSEIVQAVHANTVMDVKAQGSFHIRYRDLETRVTQTLFGAGRRKVSGGNRHYFILQ